MSDVVLIRRASPAEIAEVISIDDDACALYDSAGLHFDSGPDHPFARAEWAHWARAADAGNVFFAVASCSARAPSGCWSCTASTARRTSNSSPSE